MKNLFKSQKKKDEEVKKTEKTPLVSDNTDKPIEFEVEPVDWDQFVFEPAVNAPVKKDFKPTEREKIFGKQKSFGKDEGKGEGKGEKKETKSVYKPTYKPPTLYKKLYVILIEDTAEVAKHNEKLIKIIKKFVPTGTICIVRYGETVGELKITETFKLKDENYCCSADAGEKACLSDALIGLSELINGEYMVQKSNGYRDVVINSLEIIGIGTCKDDSAAESKEKAIEAFSKVLKKPNVTSKYFCLTEDSFIKVAEIGFHSIGSISNNY